FSGMTLAEKLVKHQQAEPPRLEDFRTDLPPALISVVRKMLAKRPEDRYQTPAEVAQFLTLHSDSGRPATATSQLLSKLNLRNWRRRRVVVGLAAATIIPLGYWLFSPSPLQRLRNKLQDRNTSLNEAWEQYQSFYKRYAGTQDA